MKIIAIALRWIGAVLALLFLGISMTIGGVVEGVGIGIVILTLFWAPAWIFDKFAK